MNSVWYRAGAWAVRLLLLAVLIQQLIVGVAVGALSMALFLVLSFTYMLRESKLPNMFDALVSLAALLNALGFVFSLYREVALYDNAAHAVTIFSVTLSFFFVIYRDELNRTRTAMMATAVFTFGVTVGSLWEIVEWVSEQVLDMNVVFGLYDTATDLITNTVAALVAGLVALLFGTDKAGPREQDNAKPTDAVRDRNPL